MTETFNSQQLKHQALAGEDEHFGTQTLSVRKYPVPWFEDICQGDCGKSKSLNSGPLDESEFITAPDLLTLWESVSLNARMMMIRTLQSLTTKMSRFTAPSAMWEYTSQIRGQMNSSAIKEKEAQHGGSSLQLVGCSTRPPSPVRRFIRPPYPAGNTQESSTPGCRPFSCLGGA